MFSLLLEHLQRGRFNFLRPTSEEIRRLIPEAKRMLPTPLQIVLDDESATPLVGFAILRSDRSRALDEALLQYLDVEEEAQCAYLRREGFDSKVYASRWRRYASLLSDALSNAIISNHGQNFPAIFWLFHSLVITDRLKKVARRVTRRDVELGRSHGDAIKYRILLKLLDRLTDLTYDVVQEVSTKVDSEEDAIFPELLTCMRDNVLIFSEDYIGSDLSELASYFHGHLHLDGRDLRARLAATEAWHRTHAAADPLLRTALSALLGVEPERDGLGRGALTNCGYTTFLAQHPAYDPTRLLDREQVAVWERLLVKLKEFELLHALRRMIVPLEREEDGALVARGRSANTTWVGGPPVLRLSPSTRPIDFMMPWVVDPVVKRYGLVYDISDFSTTLTLLGRAEASALDRAFRMMFRFQRRVNRAAISHQLKLEKYLGDGAFFSARRARQMLIVAIELQRIYRQAIEEGFPFDRGLRVAANYGQYRLLPLEEGSKNQRQVRYEFFGHGLVELSRLATGKAAQAVDDFRTYLVAQGYPEVSVNKFFAPILRRSAELGSPHEENRRFYAYINSNDTLINEGIVATEELVSRLGSFDDMHLAVEEQRRYIVVTLRDDHGGGVVAGLRKLGLSRFKGLGKISVYEVVDASDWDRSEFRSLAGQTLMTGLKRLFAATVSARQKQRAAEQRVS